jgi:hypothetical protein
MIKGFRTRQGNESSVSLFWAYRFMFCSFSGPKIALIFVLGLSASVGFDTSPVCSSGLDLQPPLSFRSDVLSVTHALHLTAGDGGVWPSGKVQVELAT